MPDFSLTQCRALVTGASRGIGQGLAVALAEAGADVICVSSRPGGCDETVARIASMGTVKVDQLHADLSDMQAVQALADDALRLWGGIDILVNNGGTIFRSPATEYPLAQWQNVLSVNLDASFLLCQQLGKKMVEQGSGKIINIASMLSFSGGITVPAYTASKHAVAGITKALANEWGQHLLV